MDKLLLGIKGHAVCLSKKTGDKLWSTKLKSTSGVTSIFVEDDSVFAYSSGHVFCLDLSNGKIKWENKLEGLGYGPCIIASETQNSSVVASQVITEQESTASFITVAGATSGGSN